MPLWLGYLSEKIFEKLPFEEAKQWPVQLLQALVSAPEDFDFEALKHKIAIDRLSALQVSNEKVMSAIKQVIKCHEKALAGSTDIDWSAVWSAESAAQSSGWERERDSILKHIKGSQ